MDSNHSSYSYTSMNNSLADQTYTTTTEESGWTAYIEDFMVTQQQDHQNTHSFTPQHDRYHDHKVQQHHRPELSDAASHADWNNINNSMSVSPPKFTKKLNIFKNTSKRTRSIRYDDSLEDTASSPVNSPRVGSPHMGFNHIKVDEIIEKSLGNGGDYEGQKSEMVFEESTNGTTDLKKRGLCLVPLSMFVNYI